MNLRDLAIVQSRKKLLHNKKIENAERTLLITGSKNVGKTNFIHQFIEKERGITNSPSTYLLDYKFARQSNKSLMNDVCHIWELGNDVTFVSLLSVITEIKHFNSICIIIMIDLTLPETIINTMETLLNEIKKLILQFVDTCEIKENRRNFNVEEEDRNYLDPFPIPLLIIGGKYDLFQNMEPVKKKIICQYLRCLAHILQADLLFYSNNDSTLIKKTRDFLLYYGFGITNHKNSVVTDYNKPLKIPAGSDSFRSIQDSLTTTVNYSLDKYKNKLIAHCDQKHKKEEPLPDDPAREMNFEEPEIDNLCKQKTEDLKHIKEKILVMQSIKQN
ncbi:hypothetical protein PGB90_002844 [Kerria lacca]